MIVWPEDICNRLQMLSRNGMQVDQWRVDYRSQKGAGPGGLEAGPQSRQGGRWWAGGEAVIVLLGPKPV